MGSSSEATRQLVIGRITRRDGTGAAGVRVSASARKLRSEAALGVATTDADGTYRIDYARPTGPVDVVVRAMRDDDVLAETVRAGAGNTEVVDLSLSSNESEYESLLAGVDTLLDGTELTDLAEDEARQDFSYLGRATGRDAERIALLGLAHRHAAATRLPAELFYGLLRQGVATDLSALAQQPVRRLREALTDASHAGVIGPVDAEDAGAFVRKLRELEVEAVVEQRGSAATAAFAGIFAAAIPKRGTRERAHRLYLDLAHKPELFWASMERDERTSPHAERLRLALQLGALTGNNVPLIQKLLTKFDDGELEDPRELAKFDAAAWQTLADEAGGVPESVQSALPPADGQTNPRYAELVEGLVAEAYPSAYVTYRLLADPVQSGTPAARFLAATPEFDLATTPVNAATVPDESVRPELAGIQRIMKLAPKFEAMQALRNKGFTSAYAVAGVGRQAFVDEFSETVGEEQASEIYSRAARVHATALNLLSDLRTSGQVDVPWLAPTRSLTGQIPNWEQLFGSADYCGCDQCRSVHGQAAYLVDLLYYMQRLGLSVPGGGGAFVPGASVGAWERNPLYLRRPDIWDVELSCDNTNLSLPYVDLVNELLESVVAPATAVNPVERQSSGTSEELRVQPQHVNPAAYDVIRSAVYPWSLPFDLFGEQGRAYLAQLGVRRHEVMTTLRPTGLNPYDVVGERLGLSVPARLTIISGAHALNPPRKLPEFWGRPADTTPEALVAELSNVRTLLDAAGLRYTELLDVLESRFVNREPRMLIESLDPDHPYDTTKMRINNLSAEALERFHRFVRFHRALGWSVPELDRAIASIGHNFLNDTTLPWIAEARDLTKRLSLSLDRVLGLFAPLEAHRYAGEAEPPLYDRLFLDPAVVAPRPGVPNPFELNEARTELKVIGSLLTPTVTAALLGVLQVTDDELAELVTGPHAVVSAGRELNRANLSALVRHVTLANALGLSVPELLNLIQVSGITPFPPIQVSDQSFAAMKAFLDAVDDLAPYGFRAADIEAVLTGASGERTGTLPSDEAVAATLTSLRGVLQAVLQQTAQDTDEKGDLVRKQLALLGWDSALVQDAVSTLLGAVTYTAKLDVLPADVVLPPEVAIRYDADAKLLSLSGPMTKADLDTLSRPAASEAYHAAVRLLFDTPRRFVETRMKAFRIPIVAAPLDALPQDYGLPEALAGKVFYDVTLRALRSRAYLSESELAALSDASADAGFKAAVRVLGEAQDAAPAEGNRFLTTSDAQTMFDPENVSPADRFHLLLTKLSPFLRRDLTETAVKQHLGRATGLDAATAELLLGTWLRSPHQPGAVLLDFLDPRFVASDPAVAVSRTGFPQQFTTYALVCRVALVLTRLRIDAEQIPWVVEFAPTAGWLDLNALPTVPSTGPSPLFGAFIRLLDLVRLRDSIPGGARTLGSVIRLARRAGATAATILDELSELTGWNRADLNTLAGPGSLALQLPQDLGDERGLLKLLAAVKLLRKLGVAADRALAWTKPALGYDDAQAAWLAAKAVHSSADWRNVAVPMQDKLREQQRSALVSYLVANPLRDSDQAPYWTDINGLHHYFMLDVEMGATQQTTRIAQAIYSVQLFVQRVRMNLEFDVQSYGNAPWLEWEWMKQYRLWEANQKVFLYPENYFEPDLRLGKSPFFAEFETELMQKELTADNVENAFLHYLEKLDTVARLQPCGMYTHEDWKTDTKTLYVVARSESTPRTYYFRTQVNDSTWTPWERIDLDIDSETLMPVVWNEQLYLFWPSFTEVSDTPPVTLPETGQSMPQPTRYWKIQLNWSRNVNGKWTAKKISQEFSITHHWLFSELDRKERYIFRPVVDEASGDLVIWCMYNLPFEGYTGAWYAWSGHFRLSARRGTVSIDPLTFRDVATVPTLVRPPHHTDTHNNEFVESPGSDGQLWLPAQSDPPNTETQLVRLLHTPGAQPFRVLYPHQYHRDWSQFVMFFTDGSRTYLLAPYMHYTEALRGGASTPPDSNGQILTLKAVTTDSRGRAGRPTAELTAVPSDVRPASVLPARASSAAELSRLSRAASTFGTNPVNANGLAWLMVDFVRFYHPHVESFIAELNRWGVDGLFSPSLQFPPEFDFEGWYDGNEWAVRTPYPGEPVEFKAGDAYAEYNWELFFHAPLLLAERLSTNQRFAEAQQWFHRIFDPTASGYRGPQRYWRTKPFIETTGPQYLEQRIEDILRRLAEGDQKVEAAVEQWLANPFQPDVVARLRSTAYQKTVVMKYLDNLIAWGDHLFRQDTLESINQATQLYILASELLGRRPDEVKDREEPAAKSYRQLFEDQSGFAQVLSEVENLLPAAAGSNLNPRIQPGGTGLAWLHYFHIPPNEKLLGYWDTVADRLFKIRHGQNIDGVERQAALFGAPIDPNLLVRAAAAGVDLETVLNDISAPVPHYRFQTMLAKAKELAGEVKAFGAALLSALEKRDAEALARLRSSHELAVLDAARDVRKQQVNEAVESLAALRKTKAAATHRQQYYSTREYMNTGESVHTTLSGTAIGLQTIAAAIDMTVSVVRLLPELKIGSPTTIGATWGGTNLGEALKGLAGSLGSIAGALNMGGSLAATLGGYDRRQDDWDYQSGQAEIDIEQIDRQIAAGTVRQAITEKELENHDLQRDSAREADRFMRDKYTNQELYDWMIGQLSTSYFQAYQLAYDVAKRAERAYRHELGLESSAFVKFGYWDSLHKGLLAGERLAADLNRMDASYVELNAREFELSKRVSLAQLDPAALLQLKETGKCLVSVPEALLDLDCPGHYMRRLKNVSVSVPCVAGPYAGVNLTLTLLRSSVRVDPRLGDDGKYARKPNDNRFRDQIGAVESIVTSTGQDDTGLFESNLHDERYLPFEGTGVISEWQLSLPQEFRQFDYESITDVVLHLRYTAREGGSGLARATVNELHDALKTWAHPGGGNGLYRVLSARREFSDEWNRFLYPATSNEDLALTFTIAKDRFPYLFRHDQIEISKPQLVLVLSGDLAPNGDKRYVELYPDGGRLAVSLELPEADAHTDELVAEPGLGGQPRCAYEAVKAVVNTQPQSWRVSVPRAAVQGLHPNLRANDHLNPAAVIDLLLVLPYTVE